VNQTKVRTDLGLAVSAELVQKLVGYVVIVLLARYLDKARMGEYFFAAAVSAMFAMPAELGTSKYLVRTAAERPDDAGDALSRVVTLRLPLAALSFAVLAGLTALLRPDILLVMTLTAAYTLIGDLYYSFGATFVGLRRMKLRFATAAVGHVALLGAVVVGVRTGGTLPQILTGYVGANLVAVAAAVLVMRVRVGHVGLRWDPEGVLSIVRESWPFFLLAVLGLVQFKVDTVMIFFLGSATGVANYESAYKLLEVSRIAVRPLNLIFFPIAARLAVGEDWEELRRLVRRLVLGVGGLGLLATLVMTAAAGFIVPLIWGSRYADAVPILRVLYLTAAPLYVGFVCSFTAFALHLERQTLRVLAAAAALNLAANAFAIPLAGPIGAAWTTLATELFIAGWLLVLIRRHLRPAEIGGGSAQTR
jgi:O-antigen/teichoic acid export membrane protein